MNICAECLHFKGSTYGETKFHTCKHSECRHPVSGMPQTCVDMRKKTGACGVAGTNWKLGHVGQTVKKPLKVVGTK